MTTNLLQRIDILEQLGNYITGNDPDWEAAKHKAAVENGWFIPEFIDIAVNNIATQFLHPSILKEWMSAYPALPVPEDQQKTVGVVMAGNIPLVGFHDFLCVLMSGHKGLFKTSSKDDVLIKHIAQQLQQWDPSLTVAISFSEMLKGCDAYIATGSNNTSGYFEYYFGKYPHLIRKNRTSVAVLNGAETASDLDKLADDVFLFFGRGCRNVTKLYVPEGYDFIPLLHAFKKYDFLSDHHKYKNNYDYNLALHLLNSKLYMSTPALILVEDKNFFSPISELHYEHYTNIETVLPDISNNENLQCIIGNGFTGFGMAQQPQIATYADGADTMKFLESLQKS